MKKALLLLLLFSVFLSLQAQKLLPLESQEFGDRVFNPNYIPTITGKLLNYSPTTDPDLIITYVIIGLGPTWQETRTAEIQADGTFRLELDYGYTYQEVFLIIGNYFFKGMYAHEDLEVYIDLAVIKTKRKNVYGEGFWYQGPDSLLTLQINSRIENKSSIRSILENKIDKQITQDGGDLARRLKKTQKLFDRLSKIDNAFFEKNPSPYRSLFNNNQLSEFYSSIFELHIEEEINPKLLAEALAHKPRLVSNGSYFYYSSLKSMIGPYGKKEIAQIHQEVLTTKLDETDQGRAIKKFLEVNKKKINGESYHEESYLAGEKFLTLYKKEIEEAKTEVYLKNISQLPFEKADILRLIGQPRDLYQREKYLTKVIPEVQLEWVKIMMQKSIEKERRQIARIEASIKHSLPLSENHSLGENLVNPNENTQLFVAKEENIETVISSILNTYPEKNIIFDIWATWCGPCIFDMQQSGPIKKELKKLPVEVVYICVANGTDQEKWKAKVLELDLSGTHIFLNQKLSSELMAKFKLLGYPSYLFIDKDRNIDKNFIQGISRINIEELKKRL